MKNVLLFALLTAFLQSCNTVPASPNAEAQISGTPLPEKALQNNCNAVTETAFRASMVANVPGVAVELLPEDHLVVFLAAFNLSWEPTNIKADSIMIFTHPQPQSEQLIVFSSGGCVSGYSQLHRYIVKQLKQGIPYKQLGAGV